mmetsp:Transcript_15831/g.17873  ORF Transcript_15831/g.17873 Transcript_15831/m.17873 type:complete len:183 (-) Transcript_15831:1010-1558(-)
MVDEQVAEKLALLTAELSKTLVNFSIQFSEIAGKDPVVTIPEPEGKKKKKKRVVDPNAPKKPHSAYVQYLQDTREQIVKDFPDLKQTEIMAKIGNLWSNLAEKTKKKYENSYQKELKKYEVEFAKYKAGKGEPVPEKKTTKKKATPKKATTKKEPKKSTSKSSASKKRKSPRGEPKVKKKKK